jgi:hypothetical protein
MKADIDATRPVPVDCTEGWRAYPGVFRRRGKAPALPHP